MTAAEKVEQAITHRPDSYVPARTLLTLLGRHPSDDDRPPVWNHAMHYGTGAVLLHVTRDGIEDVWKNDESLSCHFCTPVYADGHLYGFDGRQEEGTSLRCVEWKTGRVRWSQAGFPCGPMIAADGHLIVLSETGDLVLVEITPAGYKEKARAAVLTSPCRANLALAGGRLFARDGKKLVCWNLKR